MHPDAYTFDAPREYLVLNAGDEPVELGYDAESFKIPASDQIQTPNARGLASGKNSLGEYIPGTLVIRDIFERRSAPDDPHGMGVRGTHWSASAFVQHVLRIDPKNPATYSGAGVFKNRGIALLPLNPSPDLVAKVRAEARERYTEFMTTWANNTVHAFSERAAKKRSMGREDAMIGGDLKVYNKALGIIKKAKADMAAEADAGVEGMHAAPADEVAAMARQLAEEAAFELSKSKPDIDMAAVVEVLMADPKFRNKVKESYNLRKKRSRKDPS